MRKLFLASASAMVALLLALSGAAVIAGAWTLAGLLALWGLLVVLAGSVFVVPPGRRIGAAALAMTVATISGLVTGPRYIPGDGAGIEAVSLLPQKLSSPVLNLVPERDLMRCVERFGLTVQERRDLKDGALKGGAPEEGALLEQLLIPREEGGRSSAATTQWILDGWIFDRQAGWLIRPPGPGPYPVLCFLHGNGGPSSFYLTVLREFAEEHGIAVLIPFGCFGWWPTEWTRERLRDWRIWMEARYPVDKKRWFLAGLSAGGMGALRLFCAESDRSAWRGCAALSGVPLDVSELGDGADGGDVLIVHGSREERVGTAVVEAAVARLRDSGAQVEERWLDAGHLAFATHRAEVVDALLRWMRKR